MPVNPFVVEVLTTIARWAIVYIAGALGQQVSNDTAQKWAASAAMAGAALALSIWQRYRSRRKLVTALTMPTGTTEHEVEQHIASGASVPSVNLPKMQSPFSGGY